MSMLYFELNVLEVTFKKASEKFESLFHEDYKAEELSKLLCYCNYTTLFLIFNICIQKETIIFVPHYL